MTNHYLTSILYRGDTHDWEDSRATHRLQTAAKLLRDIGAEITTDHVDDPNRVYPSTPGGLIARHHCDYRCTSEWSEWVTPEIVSDALRFVDNGLTARGVYRRSKIH